MMNQLLSHWNRYNNYSQLIYNNYTEISFYKMTSPLLIFQDGNRDGFTIISNNIDMTQSELGQLLFSCYKYEIPILNNQKNIYFLSQLKFILNLDNEIGEPLNIINFKEREIETNLYKNGKKIIIEKKDERLKTLYEIVDDYVFTADNYYKMVLILLRIRAKIPTIIMEKTGCGKSFLIHKLSEILNNGDKNALKTLNMNSAVDKNELTRFLEEIVIPESKKLLVFFDEINENKYFYLITEILCKHSFQGQLLPSNIIFMAACQPFIMQIPSSLSYFILNFENIEKNDEKKYIKNMLEETQNDLINKYGPNENFTGEISNSILNLAINMVTAANNFIKNKNHEIYPSLRDLKRFNIFYRFFCEYFKLKRENEICLIFNSCLLEFQDNLISSIILSIILCYYLRLDNKQDRKELETILNQILIKFDKKYENFLEILYKEELFIFKKMEIKEDIIQSKALLDCLFSLFVCIVTKTPIFIIGKPGCSKSLSVQLIYKTMKGNLSNNGFFKKFSKIDIFPIQGTKYNTQEEIKTTFQNARKILKNPYYQEKVIPLILYEQIDLADRSPKNPLSILHEELENKLYEGYEKISFVGISNRLLRKTKMNCGLLLSIPDPDYEDFINISISIGKQGNSNIEKNENIMGLFKDLGILYFNYICNKTKQYIKEPNGNRNFYHFIKNISDIINIRKINILDDIKKKKIIMLGIEKNFDGLYLKDTKKIFLDIMKEYYNNRDIVNLEEKQIKYNTIQKIFENIEESNSRYLMIITQPTISEFLIKTIFSIKKIKYNYLQGSPFHTDRNNKQYISLLLQKIQYYLVQDKILIMDNLDIFYDSLYELFNQNFIKVNKKKYVRILDGFSSKFLCIN